jgi:hypothetical protein
MLKKKNFIFIVFLVLLVSSCNVNKLVVNSAIKDLEKGADKLESLTQKYVSGKISDFEYGNLFFSIDEDIDYAIEKLDYVNEEDLTIEQMEKILDVFSRLENLGYFY